MHWRPFLKYTRRKNYIEIISRLSIQIITLKKTNKWKPCQKEPKTTKTEEYLLLLLRRINLEIFRDVNCEILIWILIFLIFYTNYKDRCAYYPHWLNYKHSVRNSFPLLIGAINNVSILCCIPVYHKTGWNVSLATVNHKYS